MFHRMMFIVAALLLAAVQPALAAPATTVPIKKVYVVGDSLSDQGNLFFATGVLGALIGAPPIPDANHYDLGRFANGPNYVDYLAQKLGVTIAPSQLGGTNFAFGGARIDFNRVENRLNANPWEPVGPYPPGYFPWSIEAQRLAFLDQARNGRADPTGLYIVFAGSNDLSDALVAGAIDPSQVPGIVQNAVQGVVDVVNTFKDAGARTILVPLSPDLGLAPSVILAGAQVQGTGLSLLFNQLLVAQLQAISGPNIIVFDTFAFMHEVFLNAAAYGLTQLAVPCYTGFVTPDPNATECPDAVQDQFAFWDAEHPTTKLHSILADAMYTRALQCSRQDTGNAPARCLVNQN